MVKSSVFAALLLACSSSPKSTEPVKPVPVADPTCPVEVAGTSVTAEDTTNGAALVFVTTSDVPELRKRVAAMAVKHNEHHAAMGPLPTGTEQGGGGHDHHHHSAHGAHGGEGKPSGGTTGMTVGVHSKATSEEIDGGAKLVFIAFPDGIAKIQGELRMHAQHLASGTCKM